MHCMLMRCSADRAVHVIVTPQVHGLMGTAKTAAACLCAVALWQPLNESVCVSSLSSLLYFFLGGFWFAVANVLPHSAGEEHRLLTDQPHLTPQKLQIHFSYVTPVHQHLPSMCREYMAAESTLDASLLYKLQAACCLLQLPACTDRAVLSSYKQITLQQQT